MPRKPSPPGDLEERPLGEEDTVEDDLDLDNDFSEDSEEYFDDLFDDLDVDPDSRDTDGQGEV